MTQTATGIDQSPPLSHGAYLLTPETPSTVKIHPTRHLRSEAISFAHPFEHLLAEVLDFWEVTWEYEPHLFAIEWSPEGEAIRFFRPDFYLPDEGMYVELTAAGARVVTQKNGKLRRFAEVYPELDVRLWRARDYVGLAEHLGVTAGAVTRRPGREGDPQVRRLTGRGSTVER